MGTRGSALALAQSQAIARRIEAEHGRRVEVEVIRTTGDLQDAPLSTIGGKGLFTREIDEALLDGQVDFAVHSLKDLPTELPAGLALGAVPLREDPRDVLIGPTGQASSLDQLAPGVRVGTSSLRRAAFLRMHRRDLDVAEIRGNLDTRIRKVDSGEFGAIILASAGVRRLGLTDRVTEILPFESWLPAPGQGALGIVVRESDLDRFTWLVEIDHALTRSATAAEREVLRILEGGCRLPLAALGLPFGDRMRLKAMVLDPDGTRLVRAEATGAGDDPEGLGREVAELLLARGAALLLQDLRTDARWYGPTGVEGGR